MTASSENNRWFYRRTTTNVALECLLEVPVETRGDFHFVGYLEETLDVFPHFFYFFNKLGGASRIGFLCRGCKSSSLSLSLMTTSPRLRLLFILRSPCLTANIFRLPTFQNLKPTSDEMNTYSEAVHMDFRAHDAIES